MRFKIIIFGILTLFLTSCKKSIVESKVTILVDHKIESKITDQSNDSLRAFISPLETDSFLLSILPTIIKVDVFPNIIDSLRSNENWISSAQEWLGGGKNNWRLFKKMRIKQIAKSTLNTSFQSEGNKDYVDSFLKTNSSVYLIYSTDSIIIKSIIGQKQKGYLESVKLFSSIKDLQLFILRNSRNPAKSNENYLVYFQPSYEIQQNLSLSVIPILNDSAKILVVDSSRIEIPKHPVTSFPPPQNRDNKLNTISSEECDKRIAYCLSLSDGKNKVIYFFNEIFRFVKSTDCNKSQYEALLGTVYQFILRNPPIFTSEDGTYYSLVCSHKTDFKSELRSYQDVFSESQYDSVFSRCIN